MLSPETTYVLSLFVLAALAAVPAVAAATVIRRSTFTPPQAVLVFLSELLSKTLWRAQIDQKLPIPPGQGAIIVCNHNSPVDPWFTQLATDRVVHWMVAREYCCHPLLAWFFRTAESIPVGRGGIDTAATRQAIRYCSQGGLVGMFPEGRINVTDALLLPGRPGVAMVALKARVPVLPCYISGAPKSDSILGTFFASAKTRLKIGRLIDLSDYYDREKQSEVLSELTLRLMREIATLAGDPTYQPALAGRRWKPQV